MGKVSKYARKLTQCGFNPDCETKFGNDTSGGGLCGIEDKADYKRSWKNSF